MTNSKNETQKSKIPLIAIFFVFALIAATIVRLLQYSAVIDPLSGFFDYDGGFLNHAYYVSFAITAGIFLLLALWDKKEKRGIPNKKAAQIQLCPACSAIGAVLIAACGFWFALEFINAYSANEPIMLIILLALAALGYTFTAYVVFTHRKITTVTSIAFLFIAACYVCTAALEFMQRTYTANISSRLIILSLNVLLAIFFLNCGRIIVRRETRFTSISATLCGYLAVLLIISDSLARLFHYFTLDSSDRYTWIALNNGFELPRPVFIIQGIVVLWFLFALSSKNKNNCEQEEIKTEVEKIEEIVNKIEERMEKNEETVEDFVNRMLDIPEDKKD